MNFRELLEVNVEILYKQLKAERIKNINTLEARINRIDTELKDTELSGETRGAFEEEKIELYNLLKKGAVKEIKKRAQNIQ